MKTPIYPKKSWADDGYAELLAPRPELICASCDRPGATPGYGEPGFELCEMCITRLPATTVDERIRAKKAAAGKT